MEFSRRDFLANLSRAALFFSVGKGWRSLVLTGTGLPDEKELTLRFAIVSDGHYGQPGTSYEPRHQEMLDWLEQEAKGRGIAFCFINGDLFHNEVRFLPEAKKIWDGLPVPYYVSHGNHDWVLEAGWKEIWNMDWNYSFSKEDTGFLVLNTADHNGNYTCPDLGWTEARLTSLASMKHLFVFMHITPFTWTKGGNECADLVSLFDRQANLRAIFHGHDHDQDAVKTHNNRPYFFDAHIAGSWGTDYRGYRIVEVQKSGEILTYQMNPAGAREVNRNQVG